MQELRERVLAWADKRQGHDTNPVILARRRIYILPTPQGFVFGALLFAMLLGSMNYSSSLGFVLTFFLASLGFVTMHHTHRTLQGLELRSSHAAPVFAGEEAVFPILARNTGSAFRGGVALDDGADTLDIADFNPGESTMLNLSLPAERRGWLRPKRFGLHSTYPFGLFRAWAWLRMDLRCLVYPAPANTGSLPALANIDSGDSELQGAGVDDFSGLRGYVAGDSPRHVAWRASARSGGDLLVKEFRGGGAASRHLDWAMTLHEGDTEDRLSRMTRWVIDVHARGEAWSLHMPGTDLPMNSGEEHFRRSLEVLALFELPQERDA